MIEIVYDNILLVDGAIMTENDGPRQLQSVLSTGNMLIRAAIDETFDRYKRTAPRVQRGSVWAMRLARPEKVFTVGALRINAVSQVNRGVFSDRRAVKERYQPFWEAVVNAGFLPEIRINQGPAIETTDKAYMLVRDTPLID